MTVTAFAVGDRVCVKADRADGFIQPWRGRFEKRRLGTVVTVTEGGRNGFTLRVMWDHRKGLNDWDWQLVMSPVDLEVVE